MSEKTVAQKLLIKPGYKVLFINAPKDYEAILGELPEGVIVEKNPTGPVDLIQVFLASREELEGQLPRLKSLLTPKSLLWVTYPKGSSKMKADINRDSIGAYAQSIGLQPVAMITVDNDWSALRLKVV